MREGARDGHTEVAPRTAVRGSADRKSAEGPQDDLPNLPPQPPGHEDVTELVDDDSYQQNRPIEQEHEEAESGIGVPGTRDQNNEEEEEVGVVEGNGNPEAARSDLEGRSVFGKKRGHHHDLALFDMSGQFVAITVWRRPSLGVAGFSLVWIPRGAGSGERERWASGIGNSYILRCTVRGMSIFTCKSSS